MPAQSSAVRGRPITLSREGSVFRLAFAYRADLVTQAKDLPFATFDPETKSWTAAVCTQTIQQLRRMWHEGLIDLGPDELLHTGEQVAEAREAVLRSGTNKRPYYVHFATRGSTRFPAFRAIPSAQWEKKAGALSYPPHAAAALADMVDRGILDDPENLLTSAGVTISFDGRTGRFAVRGDGRAAGVFNTYFPARDVVTEWKAKGLDVDFLDDYTAMMYAGELARVGDGFQPDGLKLDLRLFQKQAVALALARPGLGVYLDPGLGKCLHPETPVWVNGQLRPIGELFDAEAGDLWSDGEGEWATPRHTLQVHALDESNQHITVPATRLYRQRVAEDLLRVTLEDGSVVTITKAHKLLVEHTGWTTTFDVGDRVAIPSSVAWSGKPFDLDVVKLLAWQIGEGYEGNGSSQYSTRITQKDVSVLEDLRATWVRVADRHGFSPGVARIHQRLGQCAELSYHSKAWRDLLESWGYTWGRRSAQKSVPAFVMRGNTEVVGTFLSHYYAAEGHVGANQTVELTSASETLMRQVQYLLRRFGIRMTLARRMKAATNGTNIQRPYWTGTVLGLSLARFNEHIGIADERKQARLDEICLKAGRTSVETFDVHRHLNAAQEAAFGLSTAALLAQGDQGTRFVSAMDPTRRLTRDRIRACVTGLERTLAGETRDIYRSRWDELQARGGKGSTSPKLRLAVTQLDRLAADEAAQLRLAVATTALRDAAEQDVWWTRIVSVEEIPYQGYVYDLEVEGPHNFVAGGMYCHNTAVAIATGFELFNRDQITRTVAVVPAAVRTQWAREIAKFTPTDLDDVVVVDGDRRQRAAAYEAGRDASWVVVHYDILSRDEDDLKPLFNGAFVVADEAHRVKNFTASRTQALKALARGSRRRMALTGTPVETHPGEWFEVLSGFAMPGCLGTPGEFNERYRWPAKFGGYEGAKNLGELRERSRPYYIRFTKAQVATHLPPLQVQTLTLDPSAAYDAALRRAHQDAAKEIRGHNEAKLVKAGKGTYDADGTFKLIDEELAGEIKDGAAMTAVGQLRLLCSSPRLITGESESGRILLESGLVPDEDGPKVDEVRTLCAELLASQQRRHADYDEAGRAHDTATAEEVTGERIVLFTFSKRMANLLADRLTEDGVPFVKFTGDTASGARDAAVAAFTDPTSDVIAFIATDAAAEGLNLGTCCSTLVNVDLPWTPSKLAQRSQRIHRLDGKAPHYQVTNLVVAGTMEHGVLRLLEARTEMSDALFGERGGVRGTVGKRSRTKDVSFAAQALQEYAAARPTRGRVRKTGTKKTRQAVPEPPEDFEDAPPPEDPYETYSTDPTVRPGPRDLGDLSELPASEQLTLL